GPCALALSCRGSSHGCRSDEFTRQRGRLCGALPWTTTVSLSLRMSNSSIGKEERLAIDASPVAAPKSQGQSVELSQQPLASSCDNRRGSCRSVGTGLAAR